MAKKFDLAALMGETVSKSNTGEMRVEQIPMAEIEENESNSYARTTLTSWPSPSRLSAYSSRL